METTSLVNYQTYFESGIDYQTYVEQMEMEAKSGAEKPHAEHLPLNLHRTRRLNKTIKLNPEMTQLLSDLNQKLHWLVITEHWCGDSSQTLPVINAVSTASNGKIDLRMVYRDENPELMESHLTNGAKSIPILIQLDVNFKVLNQWGPRPEAAQHLVKALKLNPETAANYAEHVHKWYAEDKTDSTQMELLRHMRQAINSI